MGEPRKGVKKVADRHGSENSFPGLDLAEVHVSESLSLLTLVTGGDLDMLGCDR